MYSDGAVGLTYIDAGEYAVDGFDTFLKRYTALIVSVSNVRLTYVADTDRNFAQAPRCFEAWRKTVDDMLGILQHRRSNHRERETPPVGHQPSEGARLPTRARRAALIDRTSAERR